MNIKNTIKLQLLGLLTLTQLNASSANIKDINIKDYVDRGIHYYPRYVDKGLVKYGKASWYGKPFHGRLTANGERYDMYKMTAAHRTYAMNTIVKVTNLKNKKTITVRINDRGPFYHTRDIDLSYAAAKRLGMDKKGIEKIKIEVISKAKKPNFSRKIKVQVASFYSKKLANVFKTRYHLANALIVKKYVKSEKRTSYKVIVLCTPWEANRLIKSKKFVGAYKV
jgi:rare lipoprotein A